MFADRLAGYMKMRSNAFRNIGGMIRNTL